MSLDTGDNPPVDLGCLEQAKRYLVNKRCQLLGSPLRDVKGGYCHTMKSPDGQPFYLVAKCSELYYPKDDPELGLRAIVSVQRQLVTPIGVMKGFPIILAWWQTKWAQPRLKMYHPEEIQLRWGEKLNHRYGVVMINFEFGSGREIHNIARLKEWWQEKKERWKKEKPWILERLKRQSNLKRFL